MKTLKDKIVKIDDWIPEAIYVTDLKQAIKKLKKQTRPLTHQIIDKIFGDFEQKGSDGKW